FPARAWSPQKQPVMSCSLPSPSATNHLSPSLAMVIRPARSVRSQDGSRVNVEHLGWLYPLGWPTLMIPSWGAASITNGAELDVSLPWCPTLRMVLLIGRGTDASASSSASPVKRMEKFLYERRRMSEELFTSLPRAPGISIGAI